VGVEVLNDSLCQKDGEKDIIVKVCHGYQAKEIQIDQSKLKDSDHQMDRSAIQYESLYLYDRYHNNFARNLTSIPN